MTQVDLRASAEGAPLYRELGFRPTAMPAMRLAAPDAGRSAGAGPPTG